MRKFGLVKLSDLPNVIVMEGSGAPFVTQFFQAPKPGHLTSNSVLLSYGLPALELLGALLITYMSSKLYSLG